MNHRSKAWFSAFLLVVLGIGGPGCQPTMETNSPGKASSTELPKVAVARPIRKDIAQRTEQPGEIESFATAPIYAKVSGFVEKLFVEIGDRVTGPKYDSAEKLSEPGQLLAQLSAPELEDELRQKKALIVHARADVEQSAAAVKVAQSLVQSAEAHLHECEASIGRVEAVYERWASEVKRVQSLAVSQTVTQKLVDEAMEQFKASDAARLEVHAKIQSAKAKHEEANIAVEKARADLKSVEARLSVAEAELQRVESLKDYLAIRAPFDGIVTQRNIDLGVLVPAARGNQDAPLFVVMQSNRLRVFVDVPESEAGLVENGRKAIVKVPALGNRTFEGTVSRTSWALLQSTRTLRCEIDVANEDGNVRPGMYSNVELTVAEKKDALTVPRAAVLQRDGQWICLAVGSDGVIARKVVSVGLRSSTDFEIASGLEGNEEVIVANVNAFREGQTVQKSK